MIRFLRPKPAKGFKAAVRSAERAVRAAVSARTPPEFPPLWVRYKKHFYDAQHGKCGYCERFDTSEPALAARRVRRSPRRPTRSRRMDAGPEGRHVR
jgi:hypothetical protein